MNFIHDADLKELIERWWGNLQVNRGDRAELARATTEEKIFEVPAFYRLKSRLDSEDYSVYARALARTAAVLSNIRRDRDGESIGILLSKKIDYSEVKPVLRITHPDRLIRRFTSWIHRLGGEAPVAGTADLVYWWEVRRPNREFLYDFFLQETQ
jgi:hypothetical protein